MVATSSAMTLLSLHQACISSSDMMKFPKNCPLVVLNINSFFMFVSPPFICYVYIDYSKRLGSEQEDKLHQTTPILPGHEKRPPRGGMALLISGVVMRPVGCWCFVVRLVPLLGEPSRRSLALVVCVLPLLDFSLLLPHCDCCRSCVSPPLYPSIVKDPLC